MRLPCTNDPKKHEIIRGNLCNSWLKNHGNLENLIKIVVQTI